MVAVVQNGIIETADLREELRAEVGLPLRYRYGGNPPSAEPRTGRRPMPDDPGLSTTFRSYPFAIRPLVILLAERAFHALCLPEWSSLPEGRCIDCKQPLFGANPQRTRSSVAALP